MAVKLTGLTFLGFGVETTQGTPETPTGFMPIRQPKPQDVLKYVPDTGNRGYAAQTYGEYLGVVSSTYDFDGDFYPTSTVNLLANVMGTDTVTGTAVPYTHTLTLAATPGTLTVSDYYVAGFRQWPGVKVEKLAIKFTPDAGVTYTATCLGWPSVSGTAPTTWTFATQPFFLGWEAALTLNNVSTLSLTEATITIARQKSEVLFSAQNSNAPFDTFVGLMEATWDLTFYMEADTQYVLALTEQQIPVQLAFTIPGSGGDTLTFTSSAVQFTKPTIVRSQEYVEVTLSGTGIYNATDHGPIQAVATNSVATAFTTTSSN